MTVVESKEPKEGEGQEPEPSGVIVPVVEPEPKKEPEKTEPEPKSSGKTFSADDIAKARKEEKDKLYSRIESMDEELKKMRAEREEREKAAKEAEKQAAAEAKAKADEEKSAKELLAEKEGQWEQQFQALRAERERDQAILAQERQFSQVMDYRTQRIAEEAENIIPDLLDMISGNTQEEIEASIERMKAKTAKIAGDIQQAQQQARQQMPGTKVTAPPTGPVENQPGYETLSADDIRNMDMATYAKRREQLLGAAGQNRNKGLFG